MYSPANSELDQLVDTFRAITEDDVTEPLLPKMRTLLGKLERRCTHDRPGFATNAPMGIRNGVADKTTDLEGRSSWTGS